MFAKLLDIFQRLLECLEVQNNFSGVEEAQQSLQASRNSSKTPGVPGVPKQFFRGFRRSTMFAKLQNTFQRLLNA